jgi:hypothetical protein
LPADHSKCQENTGRPRDKIDYDNSITKLKSAREYMHKNPVNKRWQLVNDFTDYLYSSAAYYAKGVKHYDKLLHLNAVLL